MNVRIKEQSLRFKISEDELKKLMGGDSVYATVFLPDKNLVATINPHGRGEAMEVKMVQEHDAVYLRLLVAPQKVRELSDMGRSRAGLQQETEYLSISLQVDVREDSRKVGNKVGK